MNPPQNPELFRLCELRLGEITPADIATLTRFAACRLASFGASPSGGEDVAQRAFLAVLQGLETDQGGRRPRLVDVADEPSFENYLRGIVNSIAEGMTRTRKFGAQQTEWNDNLPCERPEAQSPSRDAQLSDLEGQLFQRLRERAPRRLIPTIDGWRSVFPYSDQIPSIRGRRKYVAQVRELAGTILSELGGLD